MKSLTKVVFLNHFVARYLAQEFPDISYVPGDLPLLLGTVTLLLGLRLKTWSLQEAKVAGFSDMQRNAPHSP